MVAKSSIGCNRGVKVVLGVVERIGVEREVGTELLEAVRWEVS
jgi:hypothetical protein